jgi:hypothetical protein
MQKGTYWLENKKLFRYLMITGIVLIPVVLYFVPLEWLKSQNSICLYKNLTGNECYGCGMTRAIISAIHLKFEKAFYYNKLFLIVLPILTYIWVKTLINIWYGEVVSLKMLRKKKVFGQ